MNSESSVLGAVRSGAMTVREIGEATGISRITLYKYLAVLEAKGMIKSEYIGSTKLYTAVKTAGTMPESSEKEGFIWKSE